MALTTVQLVQIVSNGGSLEIDGRHYSTQDLVQIVANSKPGSMIVLRGLESRSQQDLVQIASNGSGRVRFVFM